MGSADITVQNPGANAPRERKVLSEMGRAKKAESAEKLTAEEQRELADALAGIHDRLRLWRKCKNPSCRRQQTCGGEVDECGARRSPQGWPWVHHVLKAMREGHSPGAAVRAANRRVLGRRVVIDCGFGEPVRWLHGEDGKAIVVETWPTRVPFEAEIKPLIGASGAWLRGAPRGKAKA
jgi:hypothetical protein